MTPGTPRPGGEDSSTWFWTGYLRDTPADTPCPDDESLRALLLGLPTSPDLDEHFRGCPRCAARVAHLGGPKDPWIDAVRSVATAVMPVAPPVPPAVLARLCRLGTLPEAPSDDRRIGPYRIERRIGAGGMGEVFLARHERMSRPVAVKVLPAGASAADAVRFRREAEVVAALRHPHIVQVYEVGGADGRPYLAMEYLPGGTLAERLLPAPLPAREAAALIQVVAAAVAAAHACGVIHRDLKPGNILLDPPHGPKVADFGLAKHFGATAGPELRTVSGALLGTPAYMAPEQADGRADIGPGADVYGLGAILYECLTGRPPFKAATVLETLDHVRAREPVPVRRLQPAVPRDLETVCLRCLEKEPARRYPTAAALADDLERFLRGEPVHARPVGAVARGWKWTRRRPTVAALLLTVAALVLGLVGAVVAYTVRLRAEVDRANASAAEADRQRAHAASNYRAAREALRRTLTRLDDRRLAGVPRLRELREDLLEDSLAFYESVLAGLDDPDPAIRLDAALAGVEVGTHQFLLGRQKAARETFHRVTAELERLPAGYRDRPDARVGLVHCYNYLAQLSGGGDESEGYCLKARAEAETLVRDDPTDPMRQNTLARVEHNLGQLFHLQGRPGPAETHYRRAVGIRVGLVNRHPADEAVRANLGEDYINLGLLLHQTKRPREAVEAFTRAEGLLRLLAETHPENEQYALSLAGLFVNWGNLLMSDSDRTGALARYDRAVALADAVLTREPQFTTARRRAVEAHGARALIREAQGKLADAIADWDRVVEYADAATRPDFRVGRVLRMARLARVGMYARSATEAHDLAVVPRLTDESRYYLACVLALLVEPARAVHPLGPLVGCAAADRHAATAVGLLRQLHEHGYFRNPENARSLAVDINLNSLRDRPDFRQLLREVAGPP